MKRSQKRAFQKEKKSTGKIIAIVFIVLSAICSTAIVAWLWINNWDVQKSYERAIDELNLEQYIPSKSQTDDDQTIENTPNDESNKERDEEQKNELDGEDVTKNPQQNKTEEELIDATKYIDGQKLPKEPTYIQDVLIANKQYPLPSTFAPGESKEAREAFNEMAAAASLEGFDLIAFSTYRSYDRQVELYDGYVERDGVEAADRYSARPGYSEHQTGLAFDIGEVNREKNWASERFGKTEAGKWVADHAHEYGFIMRYPEGKEEVTGYMHESWHFRYVGKSIAKEIHKNDATLEEYLGIR